MTSEPCDLSILIPALNEADSLAELLPQLHAVLAPMCLRYEIIVIDEQANAQMQAVAAANGIRELSPPTRGYGRALAAGFKEACGTYVLTMDADLSHPSRFLQDLWAARDTAEVVIASRYTPGGRAVMPSDRLFLSRVLNLAFSRGLDLHVKDMSSGFRLYHGRVVREQTFEAKDFDMLEEVLVLALMNGYRVQEVPFTYEPRRYGSTRVRMIQFGLAYLKTFGRMWRMRNSFASADYDSRAYDSLLPPQRYWQRQRFKHITRLLPRQGPCLDVGSGSSRIIGALPAGSVALDLRLGKLRFARRFGREVVQGSALTLPVSSGSFPCVLCSQVIEHVPRATVLSELDRVLRPGGLLILGTLDYARWQWRLMEWLYKVLMPHAYAEAYLTRYTRAELIEAFVRERGYKLEAEHYILRGELILALRKPAGDLAHSG